MDLAVVPSLETVDPAIASEPEPNAKSFPTYTAPALKVAPPLNVFAPPNVSAPEPSFVNVNAPLKMPLITTSLFTVNVVFATNEPEPLSVKTPVFVA
jgi:hypothetical protein